MAKCLVCDKVIEDYEPKFCCNGQDCGCLGLPIEPPLCSNECEEIFWNKEIEK
jgi:hypothetical protein